MLEYCEAIFALPAGLNGVVVEAGCFKGGSTAKLSLAVALVERRLVVFDSFEGLPAHCEQHGSSIFGRPIEFFPGQYAGTFQEVVANVGAYGRLDVCRFVPGWFSDTLVTFSEPVSCGVLDVDLVQSTKDCLTHLVPLLQPGGSLFSHDGHLPLVIRCLEDEYFWRREVGVPPPSIEGLGQKKVVKIVPSQNHV